MEINMKISVIVPIAGNREKEVKELLKSLLVQSKDFYEVIFAVDESKNLANYLKSLKKKYKKIRVLFSEIKRGRCKAKNEAALNSRGDILVFLDDDVEILSKNYFTIIKSHFKNPKVGAVSGREIKLKKKSKLKKILFSKRVGFINSLGEVISNFDTQTGRPILTLALPGCNFAVRRSVFFDVGGFDESYDIGTAYREETDLQIRIRKKGYYLIFDPRISVLHKEKETALTFKKWFKWYYVLNTYFFLKNFEPNFFKFLMFLFKEVIGAIARTIFYKKPYPLIYYYNILDGIKHYRRKMKE